MPRFCSRVVWVAYAKSLILLWGFKRYSGTGKAENPQYINAHERALPT